MWRPFFLRASESRRIVFISSLFSANNGDDRHPLFTLTSLLFLWDKGRAVPREYYLAANRVPVLSLSLLFSNYNNIFRKQFKGANAITNVACYHFSTLINCLIINVIGGRSGINGNNNSNNNRVVRTAAAALLFSCTSLPSGIAGVFFPRAARSGS